MVSPSRRPAISIGFFQCQILGTYQVSSEFVLVSSSLKVLMATYILRAVPLAGYRCFTKALLAPTLFHDSCKRDPLPIFLWVGPAKRSRPRGSFVHRVWRSRGCTRVTVVSDLINFTGVLKDCLRHYTRRFSPSWSSKPTSDRRC